MIFAFPFGMFVTTKHQYSISTLNGVCSHIMQFALTQSNGNFILLLLLRRLSASHSATSSAPPTSSTCSVCRKWGEHSAEIGRLVEAQSLKFGVTTAIWTEVMVEDSPIEVTVCACPVIRSHTASTTRGLDCVQLTTPFPPAIEGPARFLQLHP